MSALLKSPVSRPLVVAVQRKPRSSSKMGERKARARPQVVVVEEKGRAPLRGRRSSSAPGPSLRAISLPATTGTIMGGFGVRASSDVQKLVDYDGPGTRTGLRLRGSDFWIAATTSASGQGFIGGGFTSILITPGGVSTRLTNFTACYQRYAFRDLRIRYVPLVGSSTAGCFAMALVPNPVLGVVVDTIPEVLQFSPSSMGPVWASSEIRLQFDGTRTWQCSNISPLAATDYNQARFHSIGSGLTASTNYGSWVVEYVIDLYDPCPVQTNLSAEQKKVPEVEKEKVEKLPEPVLVSRDGFATGTGRYVLVDQSPSSSPAPMLPSEPRQPRR